MYYSYIYWMTEFSYELFYSYTYFSYVYVLFYLFYWHEISVLVASYKSFLFSSVVISLAWETLLTKGLFVFYGEFEQSSELSSKIIT